MLHPLEDHFDVKISLNDDVKSTTLLADASDSPYYSHHSFVFRFSRNYSELLMHDMHQQDYHQEHWEMMEMLRKLYNWLLKKERTLFYNFLPQPFPSPQSWAGLQRATELLLEKSWRVPLCTPPSRPVVAGRFWSLLGEPVKPKATPLILLFYNTLVFSSSCYYLNASSSSCDIRLTPSHSVF